MKYPMINIGSEQYPDFLCIKHIARYKKVPKTMFWELYFGGGTQTNEVPIRISDDQFEEIQMMMTEKELMEEKEEHRPPVKRMVVVDEDSLRY